MRNHAKPFWAVAFITGAFLLGSVAAGQDVNKNSANERDEAKVVTAHSFRTADLVGMNVRNKQGETLGRIDDLVIDMKTGDVRYAALGVGGVAGIGSKLFAVPWSSMTFVFGEPSNKNDRHFVLDMSQDDFNRSPGFDSSHWPNVADPKWAASVDKHYNVKRQEEPAPATTEEQGRQTVAYETVFRASKIKGMDVRNEANENLGDVNELVINVKHGKVNYLALSFGSIFTGGNKLFAVPLSACTLTHDNNKTFITLHVSQDALKNAPGFDKNHWPDTADPNWAKDIDSFYERTATRRTTIRQ